jgi:anti-anti-sigma factor
MEPTRVTVDETADVTVARIDGELDKLAADAVRSRLDDLEGDRLVIDLGGVTFLDSAGLHALFELGRAVAERGGRLALAVAEGSPAGRVVELAHFAAVIPVRGTVAEATRALGSVS